MLIKTESENISEYKEFCLTFVCPITKCIQLYESQFSVTKKGNIDLIIQKVQLLDDSYTPEVGSRSPNHEENSLLEYGTKIFKDSGDSIKTYITFMIPLTTALLTSYIALLKLKGVESLSVTNTNLPENLLFPPLLMLVSIILFITANFPFRGRVNLNDLRSINKYRVISLSLKPISDQSCSH